MADTPDDEAYLFRFHYLDRRNDTDRPKLYTSRWAMHLSDARRRVERGEWLIAVPATHDVSYLDYHYGRREIDSRAAQILIERLIREGKVYQVKPTYDHSEG